MRLQRLSAVDFSWLVPGSAEHRVMSIPLNRPQRRRIRLGPTLAGRPRLPRTPSALLGLAVRSLVVGIAFALLVMWREVTSPTSALILGGAVLLWAMSTFSMERPRR